jgi:uncharacterized membrane protein HdeD (DUF308 family)
MMTGTALDTLKVSAGFDINAEFRSVMHELGLSPEDTGVVVLAYPFDSVVTLTLVVGVWLIVLGMIEVISGFGMRSDVKRVEYVTGSDGPAHAVAH